MASAAPVTDAATRRANIRTAIIAAIGVAAMVGLGYAAVPLYRLFCQVTGLNGTTQRAEAAPGGVTGKLVTVDFDANVSPRLPWKFKPVQASQTVTIGARTMAFYTATNTSDRPFKGTAGFNVTPDAAGKYFTKIECFCFTDQVLKPGQTMQMPVIYYVDPAILTDPDAKDIRTITLSYTFYAVDSAKSAG